MFQKYECGRDDKILKWKSSSHNSVDFKLQIVREEGLGMVPKSVRKDMGISIPSRQCTLEETHLANSNWVLR